jgi:hypothetical protein
MKEYVALKIAMRHYYHGRDEVGNRTERDVIYECCSG